MIGASLQFLATQLNLHLRRTLSVREDLVVVSRMLENDGKDCEEAANSPDMPEGLEKLSIDMESLNMQEMNNLWGTIGAKYVPSGGNYSYYQPYVIRLPENTELGVI